MNKQIITRIKNYILLGYFSSGIVMPFVNEKASGNEDEIKQYFFKILEKTEEKLNHLKEIIHLKIENKNVYYDYLGAFTFEIDIEFIQEENQVDIPTIIEKTFSNCFFWEVFKNKDFIEKYFDVHD